MAKLSFEDIFIQVLSTEQELLKVRQKMSHKEQNYRGASDLNGLCREGATILSRKLNKKGIRSKIIFGKYDIPLAGGNGKEIRIPHYWVETQFRNTKLIADPTCRQFAKYLPQSKLTSGKFKVPFLGEFSSAQAAPYIK